MNKTKVIKILSLLNYLDSFLSVIFLIALFIQVILGIFFRYILNVPLVWNDELCRFLFIFMVFLGASGAVQTKSHIKIRFIVSRLPGKYQGIIELLIDFLIIFFLFNLIYWGILFSIRLRSMVTSAMEIPWIFVYCIIPITASIMCIRYIIKTINRLMVFIIKN